MSRILALDPGTEKTGVVIMDSDGVRWSDTLDNYTLLQYLRGETLEYDHLAIEMVACYGMAVGREVFETCVWIGRFDEASSLCPQFVFRKDVKIHLCGTMKAKDPNIRQALLDKYGPVGTKKAPGPLFGISGHLWAALAVADYAKENPKP